MIKVKIEIWMWMGKELGVDFDSLSEMRSMLEKDVKDGTTITKFIQSLARRYQPIREKIFDIDKNIFYSNVVVTLNDRVLIFREANNRVLDDRDKITVLPMYTGG